MNSESLHDHFNSLIASMDKLFDGTSLRFDVISKLKNEFSQLINEIRPLLANESGISSISFERSMSQLSDLCQRIFFASNKVPKDPDAIIQFFSDLHYPIDLSDQYFDEEFLDEDDQIVYLNFQHNEIFDKK